MSTKCQITPENYVASGLLHEEKTKKSKVIHYIMDSTLIVGGVTALYFGSLILAGVFLGVAIGGNLLLLLAKRFIIPWQLKRHYEKYNNIKKPFTIALNNDDVKFESDDGTGKLKWEDIYKWRENSELILIYIAPKIYYIIPKRISEDGFPILELQNELTKHVGIPT